MSQLRRSLAGASLGLALLSAGIARADGGDAPVDLPALIALEPVNAPIVDHGEMIGRLELRLMWRAPDEAARALAERRAPLLRAALVEAAAEHARLEATPAHPVNVARLAAAATRRAGAQGISGELLVLEATTRPG